MKTTFNVDFLKYVDSILGQCGKKANTLGIHNDGEKIVFFIPQLELRLDFLNDIRIAVQSNIGEKFTFGMEYEIFKKLLSKDGLLEFDITDTYLSVKSDSGKHKFKIYSIEYEEPIILKTKTYELFTTDLSVPFSMIWEPDYNAKNVGNFVNDVCISLNDKTISMVTTNRDLITRSCNEITNKEIAFGVERISIPGNSLAFILSTLRDLNVLKLAISDKDIQVLLSESKFASTLKYNIKLSATSFPDVTQLLLYDPDSFHINTISFKNFIESFVTIKDENLKEVVTLLIDGDLLKISLVHKEHESESELRVTPIPNSQKIVAYFDMNYLKSVIKNIPKGSILHIGLFETKIHIRTEDNQFSSVIMGINPGSIGVKNETRESSKETDSDQSN